MDRSASKGRLILTTDRMVWHLLCLFICLSLTHVNAEVPIAYDIDLKQQVSLIRINELDDKEKKINDMSITMEDMVRSLHDSGIDFSYLVDEYNKICPGLSPRCEECSCESYCGLARTCCPDCPYAFLKIGCYDVAIIGQNARRLIDDCPGTFEGATEVEEMCASNSSELAPVSSGTLDFKNKHCAACHGSNVDATWEIVLNCKQPIPDNITVDAKLENKLYNLGCIATFQHPLGGFGKTFTCDLDSTLAGHKISKCNVTGLWKVADSNLVWGCESLDTLPVYDRSFKNVFCYLCNPSIASTTKLDEIRMCDVCKNETISERLLPYGSKCMMDCNGVHESIRKLRVSANDTVNLYVDEFVNTITCKSSVRVSMTVFDIGDVNSAVKPLFIDVYGSVELYNKENGNSIYNILKKNAPSFSQEQIRTYAAVCGDSLVCDKTLLPEDQFTVLKEQIEVHARVNDSYQSDDAYGGSHNDSSYQPDMLTDLFPAPIINPICGSYCSCDTSCVIEDHCCVDTLVMKEPFTCYSEHDMLTIYPTSFDSARQSSTSTGPSNDFSVISNCLNTTSSYLNSMCSNTANKMDIFNFIPVKVDNLDFKNIYCYKCYFESHAVEIQIDMQLECDSYLEADHFPDVYTLLKAVRDNCKTTFKPSYGNNCRKPYVEGMSVSGTHYLSETEESFSENKVTFVHKCNETGQWIKDDNKIRRLCEEDSDSILRLPEYRIDSTVYKNFACFECNPDLPNVSVSGIAVIEKCSDPIHPSHESLQSLCAETLSHHRWFPYKNLYCAMCNKPPLTEIGIWIAPPDIVEGIYHSATSGRIQLYTYRDLFSLTDLARGRPTPDVSSCSGIFDSKQNLCHTFKCAKGREMVNSTCHIRPDTRPSGYDQAPMLREGPHVNADNTQPRAPDPKVNVFKHELIRPNLFLEDVNPFNVTKAIYYKLRLRIKSQITTILSEVGVLFFDELCKDLLSSVLARAGVMPLDLSYKCEVFNISCGQINVTSQDFDSLIVSYDMKAPDAHVPDIETILVNSLGDKHIVRASSGRNIMLVSSPVSKRYTVLSNVSKCVYEHNWERKGNPFGQMIYIDKFLTCPYIVLNQTEVEINNESNYITLQRNYFTFAPENYEQDGDTFIICEEDYNHGQVSNDHEVPMNMYDMVYLIFNYICVISSLVCLMITFMTFSLFKQLRTVPGKNIMTLTLSLFLAQLFILVGPFITDDGLGCSIIGALIHFWWLSMFCAMCACSFHMFKLFYINFMSPPTQGSGSNYTVAKYNVFVFGLPLVIVSVVIMYNIITTKGEFAGYGRTQICFLAGFYPVLFAFVLPSLLTTIISITLFSMSFHQIRSAPNMSCNQDRKDVAIYIKLCTIVGLAWPLQILDGIFDISVLSFVAVALNGLQGVFIFAAYICNTRVLGFYKGLFCGKQRTLSSGTLRYGTSNGRTDVTGTMV